MVRRLRLAEEPKAQNYRDVTTKHGVDLSKLQDLRSELDDFFSTDAERKVARLDTRYREAKDKFMALGRPRDTEPKETLVSTLNAFSLPKFMKNPHAYLALLDYLSEHTLIPE